MSQFFKIHPQNPQMHLIQHTAEILKAGGVIVYPTDSAYALGCTIGNKEALTRIRRIRGLDEKHNFTLMCRDLSDIATYARVSDAAFRLLKAFTPGPYTFLLKATPEVPKRLQHPKRKTIGLRIPSNSIAKAILEVLEQPMMSTTLILPAMEVPLIKPQAIADLLGKQVDLIIDGGYSGIEQTTVVDLEGEKPKIVRVGKGDEKPFLNL